MRSLKVKEPAFGAGAGLVALALAFGVLGGLAWGALRPAYLAEVADGGVQIDTAASPLNTEFAAFGWFVLLTGFLGVLLALVAWRVTRRRGVGGVGWLWWIIACAAAGAFTVYVFGDWFALWLHHVPSHEELEMLSDGSRFDLIPPIRPGAGWLAGPFTAALSYWTLNAFGPADAEPASPEAATAPQSDPAPVG